MKDLVRQIALLNITGTYPSLLEEAGLILQAIERMVRTKRGVPNSGIVRRILQGGIIRKFHRYLSRIEITDLRHRAATTEERLATEVIPVRGTKQRDDYEVGAVTSGAGVDKLDSTLSHKSPQQSASSTVAAEEQRKVQALFIATHCC
ncbi:hypothetical protein PM082_012393 [Marasmius tenuissimus]|nr:hypothetical protein PM082_012393 [Marasmius tenuissimus]